jgi:hypothetical protein
VTLRASPAVHPISKPSSQRGIEGPWVDLGVANVPGRFAPGDPWTPRSGGMVEGPGVDLGAPGF